MRELDNGSQAKIRRTSVAQNAASSSNDPGAIVPAGPFRRNLSPNVVPQTDACTSDTMYHFSQEQVDAFWTQMRDGLRQDWAQIHLEFSRLTEEDRRIVCQTFGAREQRIVDRAQAHMEILQNEANFAVSVLKDEVTANQACASYYERGEAKM